MLKFKTDQLYLSTNNYQFALIPTIIIDKTTLKKRPLWTVSRTIRIDFLNYRFVINYRYKKQPTK